MKESWKLIPVPSPLDKRPRDGRGFPIPAVVFINPETKRADFAVIDPEASKRLSFYRCCGLCGEIIAHEVYFVAGEGIPSEAALFGGIGPMHADCARYALQVCPFIVAPKMEYAENTPEHAHINSIPMLPGKPDFFCLYQTADFEPLEASGSSIVFKAPGAAPIERWREGRLIETIATKIKERRQLHPMATPQKAKKKR
jgi:hypothetical protein